MEEREGKESAPLDLNPGDATDIEHSVAIAVCFEIMQKKVTVKEILNFTLILRLNKMSLL